MASKKKCHQVLVAQQDVKLSKASHALVAGAKNATAC
jgi:hypothetical protein